jgi:antitoxin (DNA-binding transcriptional repressor) of toxin-antitoxin stability system
MRRVQAGETIEVTDRGRPVAVLAPLPVGDPIERLRAAGDLVPSQQDLAGLPEPLPLAPGQEPPSRCSSAFGGMSADRATYLDASVLVKLAVREPESEALRRYIGRRSAAGFQRAESN